LRKIMNNWRFIDSGPASGAENMAADERLLKEAAAGNALPVLRFYTWSPPAVSLGRFQDEDTSVRKEACRRRGIDIVRRITGGRAVLHDQELTYSIIARLDNDQFPNDVLGTYKVIASGLLAGLGNLGISAEMVSRSGRHAGMVRHNPKEPACFSSPSWYEILVSGRKIIGSAQRRVAGAFLQHGSILIGYDPSLEAEVIPSGRMQNAVTSIRRELGREVPSDEIKQALQKGFSEALGMIFTS
jgi:lipoate-protein ligase A